MFMVLAAALILGGLAGCVTAPPPLPRVIVEPPPPPPPPPEESLEIDSRRFAKINQVASAEVAAGHVPGAVILVGHRGKTVYRKAFGQCALVPQCQPMKVDTIFDLASLTKVVATTLVREAISKMVSTFMGWHRGIRAHWPKALR